MTATIDMGKVAQMIGADRNTVRNWVERPELADLFSPGTRQPNSRQFDERDVLVANTIKRLREQRVEWVEIGQRIRSGFLDTTLSPASVEVDAGISVMQATTRTIELRTQMDALRTELEWARQDFERRYREQRDEYWQREEKLRAHFEEQRKADLRRIEDLQRELGRLEGRTGFDKEARE